MKKNLILGCGYLGRRVAQAWLDDGHEVLAVTRSTEHARYLEASQIRPIIGDVTSTLNFGACDELDTVLFAIGFDRTSGKPIRDVYVDGLRNTLEQLPAMPQRFIYISSTGVYAQNDGDWVDERSKCEPIREGGRACLEAEQLLRRHAIGSSSLILRLGGIYGPGRLPQLKDVIAGKALSAAANGHVNLIHVDDATRIILAAEHQLTPPELLVVSDGHPVLRHDFYRELARLTSSPEPRFVESSSDETAGRSSTNKRIDSSRLHELLQFTSHYPTYKEGLADVVAQPKKS